MDQRQFEEAGADQRFGVLVVRREIREIRARRSALRAEIVVQIRADAADVGIGEQHAARHERPRARRRIAIVFELIPKARRRSCRVCGIGNW